MSLFAPLANSWIASQKPYQPGRPLEEVARETLPIPVWSARLDLTLPPV